MLEGLLCGQKTMRGAYKWAPHSEVHAKCAPGWGGSIGQVVPPLLPLDFAEGFSS